MAKFVINVVTHGSNDLRLVVNAPKWATQGLVQEALESVLERLLEEELLKKEAEFAGSFPE
jgi:hypothetical protein